MKAFLATYALAAQLFAGDGYARAPQFAQKAAESDVGFLDVSSDPSSAKILIDDVDVGQTTPQHHLPVQAGHHRLTLVTADGHKLTVGFTVESGKTKKLTLYLGK